LVRVIASLKGFWIPHPYRQAALETVDRLVEASLVAVGKPQDAECPALGDRVTGLVEVRQALLQAVDGPFGLALFAIRDRLAH
jgi:hypothetical protein